MALVARPRVLYYSVFFDHCDETSIMSMSNGGFQLYGGSPTVEDQHPRREIYRNMLTYSSVEFCWTQDSDGLSLYLRKRRVFKFIFGHRGGHSSDAAASRSRTSICRCLEVRGEAGSIFSTAKTRLCSTWFRVYLYQ